MFSVSLLLMKRILGIGSDGKISPHGALKLAVGEEGPTMCYVSFMLFFFSL